MQNVHPDIMRALMDQRAAEAMAHAREARLALAARRLARARRNLAKAHRTLAIDTPPAERPGIE